MCPLVSITAIWLCVSNVLVYNNKSVEQGNAAKIVVLVVIVTSQSGYSSFRVHFNELMTNTLSVL